MARVDVGQNRSFGIVLRPKQSRIAIVSEAACELLIEYFNEMIGRYSRAVDSVAGMRASGSLQVRHQQRGWNPFSTHVGTKDPNSFQTKIEEIVKIAPDRPRRQRLA